MTEPPRPRRVLELCDRALELEGDQRAAFLDAACGADVRLRSSVESILLAIDEAGDFLDVRQPERAPASLIGQTIADYEVIRKLGEGGMGTVYLAEKHAADFRQRVAIKVMHTHLLTRDLMRRFESERRILASLHHPYIASLVGGGTTTGGAPYLVMEYVDGRPLDRYCDENRLPIPDRLQLLQKIAMAVQYAHQNLVVHRDLKPSNVLVTPDGIPKLLDFGIAKLLEGSPSKATDLTLASGRQALTPDYASPEQILDGRATTVSDVYSLGVVAYELLVGRRPCNHDAGTRRHLLRSVETMSIPRPSACLAASDPGDAASVADLRATTPGKLRRMLQGDLDNILLMALRHEPDRRYGSAAQFSDDIERHLRNLPVAARPDSVAYRFMSFARRNRLAVASSALIVISLAGGALAFAWQAREAARQRDLARAEASTAKGAVEFLKTVLFSANPWDGSENEATVADVVAYAEREIEDSYGDRPDTKAYLLAALAEIQIGRGEYEQALRHAESAIALLDEHGLLEDSRSAYVHRVYGHALADLGRNEDARDALDRAIRLYRNQPDLDWLELSTACNTRGAVFSALSQETAAEASYREALEIYERHGLDDIQHLVSVYNNLAVTLGNQARFAEAEVILADAVESARAADVSDAQVAMLLANRAGTLSNIKRYDEAAALYREALALQARSLGAEHPESLLTAASLGQMYEARGDLDNAAKTLRTALEAARKALPEGHFITAYMENVLGLVLCEQGSTGEGIALLESALRAREATYPEGHWAIASTRNSIGSCLTTAGKYAAAERLLLETLPVIREARGDAHTLTARARQRLARLYERWGRPDEAIRYRDTD